jgi:orotidine-5'-phosphate decarboxylase
MGVTLSVDEYVLRRMRGAKAAGCDGVVASGREAALIRQAVGSDLLIVTPGIRASGASSDDHKRAVTPTEAIANGADYLVVGRPITKSDSPEDATRAILEEMQTAFDRR